MGWLIVCDFLIILGIVIISATDDEDVASFVIPIMVVEIIVAIILIFTTFHFNSNTNQYYQYQQQYEEYIELGERVKQSENVFDDKMLLKDIRDYNSSIYAAKNESFMTKYLHNQRYKDLDYIEIEGMKIEKDKK